MANTITIQLRPTKKYAPPTVANLVHNAGIAKALYWIKDGNNLQQNININSTKTAVNFWRAWELQAKKIIIENKGKNPKKNQVLIEEGLLVVGKDVSERNPDIFVKIFEDFTNFFEEKYNTKILHYAVHNHEGHLENGEFKQNLHIHFFFRNTDEKGESVRRKIKKQDLSFWQTKIHQIAQKYIDVERATNYKEQGKKAPKHLSHREFRARKKSENLAKIKDLQAENKRLRTQLKEQGAGREQYSKIEATVRTLREQIKNKDLTISGLEDAINQLKQELLKKEELREKKDTENDDLWAKGYASFFLTPSSPSGDDQGEESEELEQKDKEIEQLKKENADLQSENKDLKDENARLQQLLQQLDLINSELIKTQKDLADLQIENADLQAENTRLKAENTEQTEKKKQTKKKNNQIRMMR